MQRAILCSVSLLPMMAHADIYFSEYVEGSSNNKALEIYNSGTAAVSLAGYRIEGYFNGSTTANSGFTINLSGSIPAKGVFVVAPSNANATILGKANQVFGTAWFNGDDAIVLKNASSAVIDSFGQIGVDPGNEWGSGLTSGADNTLRRKSTVTTGDTNPGDTFNPATQWDGFAMDSFEDLGSYNGGGNPENPQTGNCGDARTPIAVIQGTTDVSPFNGSAVKIEGIVVGDFQGANQLGGFFVQSSNSENDSDARTSDGIYIDGGTTAVQVGDRVRVAGTVAETFNQTRIVPTGVVVCATGQALPPATPVNFPVNALSNLEAFEGMRVSLPQTLTVTETYELGRYGQILVSNGRLMQPTNLVPPGPQAQARQAENNRNQILLDDGSNAQNPDPIVFPAPALSASNTLRGGDTVTGVVGILGYDFGAYRVTPTTAPTFVHSNPRPAAPVLPANVNLKVASFNVLNYFNGNGMGGGFPTARGATNSAEFTRQRAKIVNAIVALNVDVIGLTELENDGFGPYSAIAQLVDALNAANSGASYAYVNPGLSRIGTDEIVVGFIYRSNRVMPVGNAAILDSSVAPTFIDNKNRPVLAQTFREKNSNGVVTVAVNHLKSKGTACTDVGDLDTGDGQGNCAVTRTTAAAALVDWLESDPTNSGDKDFLIIGDLNAYAKEDPIAVIQDGGYVDLIERFNGDSAYSYVFDGQAGYLDHALASSSLAVQAVAATEWHINADEPVALDYNTDYQSAGQVTSLYSTEPYRSSDHDPLVVGLKLVQDQDGDGDVDNDDLAIVTAARNTNASAQDPRDINRDGIINANDVRALTLQCTRPRCATH